MVNPPLFRSVVPGTIPTQDFHSHLLSTISPRPIAFASTVDQHGNVNLSPFSFFNLFGSNPPILIFSPSRRVRDNTIKHTLENVIEIKEVAINIVNYSMVEQASLTSCEYGKGVNEFIKAGLTQLPSVKIRPPRVAESPASFECRVNQIIETGKEGGAGALVICEVLVAHFKENLFDSSGKIDSRKVDTVARMGGDFYCRASGDAIIEIPRPNQKTGIGVDQIPFRIRNSEILTGNDLGRLGNIDSLPLDSEVEEIKNNKAVIKIINSHSSKEQKESELHRLAHVFLKEGNLALAWKILLFSLQI